MDVDEEGVSYNTAWPRAKPRHVAPREERYPWRKPDETRVSVRIAPTRIESRGIE